MEKKELAIAKENFVAACESAKNVSILQNAAAAFEAATIVTGLRNALTEQVVKEVFMPLMNAKIGFLTDRDPSKGYTGQPYSAAVVRDAIIDAASFGLLPIGNQMNIIAGRMYPTKEGYTALLKNMGVKYKIFVGTPKYDDTKDHAQMDFSIRYSVRGAEEERYASAVSVSVNKNKSGYVVSSEDQLKGKAERRAKKQLYELLSGVELGEAADVQDAQYTEVIDTKPIDDKRAEVLQQKSAELFGKMQTETPTQEEPAQEVEGVTEEVSQPAQSNDYPYANAAAARKAKADDLPFED